MATQAENRSAIAEQEAASAQLGEDFMAEVLMDLQAVNGEIAQLRQQRIALEDQLARLVIERRKAVWCINPPFIRSVASWPPARPS